MKFERVCFCVKRGTLGMYLVLLPSDIAAVMSICLGQSLPLTELKR